MVLVLGLPAELEHRELLVSMTCGVVILSILSQGTTMGPLLRRLGLVAASEASAERDRLRGALKASRAALAEIERMGKQQGFAEQTTTELRSDYQERAQEAEQALASLHLRAGAVLEEERVIARRQALIVEKDAIVDAHRAGEIVESSYEQLLADVDARLFELESREDPPGPH
jgi:CPA1 family monovalent cation:H+ antiporter